MLSLFKVFMSSDVEQPVLNTLRSGFVTQGPRVEEFENALKSYLETEHVLTLNSGTSGLTLALRILKDKKFVTEFWPGFNDDDVVLTPALTCFATTSAILANGAKIRWLDTDLESPNIDLNDIRRKLSPKTKVIYIVHWGGCSVDLDELEKIKNECYERFGFRPMVVEDCAHAFGSTFNGKKIGSHGNICVFSLQAIKSLSTCDGGIITLPNKQMYDECKLLRWYGIDRDKRNYKGKDFRLENDITSSGYKFHMNDLNATIGIHNLPHIDRLLEKNRENARFYDENLSNIPGIKCLPVNGEPSYWLYTIRVERKEEFINFMKDNNIMTSQVHNRNDINSCVQDYNEELVNLDIIEKDLICIPVGWWLERSDMEYILSKIREFYC